jgi:hypothetical protein
MSKIETIIKMKKEYEDKLKKFGSEILKEEFKTYFEAYPEVVGIAWTQYTPWFNDGDECKFRVNDFYLVTPRLEKFSKHEEDEIDDSESWGRTEDLVTVYCSRYSRKTQSLKEIEDATNLRSKIPQDVMLAVFGDHVEVRATRKGFDISEYKHD